MNVRIWTLMLALVAILLVLSACGTAGETTPEATPPEGQETVAPEQPGAPAASGTMKFWTFEYDPAVEALLQEYVDEWNQTQEVKVEYQSFPWEQYTGEILTTGIATGEAPDIFFISPGDWRRYAESGLALPLDPYFPDYLKEDLLPASLDAVTLDGNIYSVPFEMEPVVLWYNKAIFEEAGLEPPQSWEELVDAAQQLATEERFGILIPTNPDYYQNFVWYPFLWMAGGQVVNEEFTEATINSPAGAQALGFWGDLVNEYQVAPTTSTGQDPVDERFPTGRAAMYVSGYWVYGWIQANYADFLPNLDVVTIPPPEPGGESSTVYGGWTVMVYNNTQFPDQAAEFAINLFGAEDLSRNVQWNTVLNTKLSPRQSLREEAGEFYSQFPHDFFIEEVFPISRPEPSYPPEIARSVWEALQDTMFGGRTGEQAAQAAGEKIDAFLDTR